MDLFSSRTARGICLLQLFLASTLMQATYSARASAQVRDDSLVFSRAVRPWEFLGTFGPRAALLGNEAGQLEAWMYPLKLCRNFRLRFVQAGQTLPAEALARTVIIRPESSTIIYAADTFTVKETSFIPVDQPGAVITLDIETADPLDVIAVFERDFQLEWPASIGSSDMEWDDNLHGFVLGSQTGGLLGLIASPTAASAQADYSTNYYHSGESSFHLGVIGPGHTQKTIILAASFQGRNELDQTYRELSSHSDQLRKRAAAFYADYLNRTVRLELPDEELQQAYDWGRVSVLQGVIRNPLLGTGLVAGFNISSDDRRPGYAWFFGRDALWTSFALTAAGDFPSVQQSLEFLGRHQRADGKIFHELSQSATFLAGPTDSDGGYGAADSTPLYVVANDDYVTHTGDLEFARRQWDSVSKAYEFVRSTRDRDGLASNAGVGDGWVEEGPLVPVRTELYQATLGAEASRSLAHMAQMLGKSELSQSLAREFEEQQKEIETLFWLPNSHHYAFSIGRNDKSVDVPTALATEPLWFRVLDTARADQMITELSKPEYQADWGMRMLSSQDSRYAPGGYHAGSVWPLFTGWASVGEYHYHRAQSAYSNLRANALLTFAGAPGHVAEVLSGNYHQTLATGTPHQIWSSAMVMNALLLGLFDLQVHADGHTVSLAPHLPADWARFAIRGIRVGEDTIDVRYLQTSSRLSWDIHRAGNAECVLDISPALSRHAKILAVTVDGRPLKYEIVATRYDQHVRIRVPLTREDNHLEIVVSGDIRLSYNSRLPALGDKSHGLRILSEEWTPSADTWTLDLAGEPGVVYDLVVSDASSVQSIDGGELVQGRGDHACVQVRIPDAQDARQTLILHLSPQAKRGDNRAH